MVTIDPAKVRPGEVWLVDAPAGRAGVWVGMRPGLDNGVWWRLVRVGGDGIVYLRDDDVRLRGRLVPVRPVTRGDLPTTVELVESWGGCGLQALAAHVLDVVVDRLNANGGVPASREDAALADHLGRQAVTIDELQLDLEAAERDRDRWRRAHEIVERERDEARERLREAETRLAKCMADFQDVEDERDEAVARAEAAEARTAPAVTKRELRSVVGAHDPGDDELAVSRVNALTYRLWSLVSGADPAVFVVREGDVAAVEVKRASDGWYADGAWLASADETAEWVRDRAAEMVVCAARNEAVARAIEAEEAEEAIDLVEAKAKELWEATRAEGAEVARWDEAHEFAQGQFRILARHVLGQEADQ